MVLALVLVLLASLLSPIRTAARTVDNSWRKQECKYQTYDGHVGYSDREVKITIRCAVNKFPVPSSYLGNGLETALAIANRESGFTCHADNPTSSAYGVYQVVDGTWSSWHSHLPMEWWHDKFQLNHDRGHCRVNVMVSIRIAHSQGWSAWGA